MIKNNLASLADESITKLFKSPEKNICEQKEFVSVLAKLDERLKYMQTKDSELYLMRSRQYMTRGMTRIKM
ncbi:hypothetical protein RhiirC2_732050 [Rhizophagus irregularis]|uniref:Conserved oligomeric Golgi complex subunit 3 N-terminal domain-containing protein n=1 Tax=Rhizophagus irregularis TaxID=588596 RepID=A0A2N1NU51_9GLOM|nr:hypothetical protein RhiirC2_732050 [Rhizophagus irregularis]